MDLFEILHALKNGEISINDAEEEYKIIHDNNSIKKIDKEHVKLKDGPAVINNILTVIWEVEKLKSAGVLTSNTNRVLIIGGTEKNYRAIEAYISGLCKVEIGTGEEISTITEKIKKENKFEHIVWIAPQYKLDSVGDDILINGQEEGVIQLFRFIKAMLNLGYGMKDLSWTIITENTQSIERGDKVNPLQASLEGLVGSMAKEYPYWKVSLIDLESECEWPVEEIFRLVSNPQGNQLAYRGGKWYRQKLAVVNYPEFSGTLYRKEGIYVIIGGAGGIGEVWSEYMIRNYHAKIVWIGRRKKNEDIQSKLDKLGVIGEAPWYISADAKNRKEMEEVYKEIKSRYKEIHGVIHSAIVLHDQSLARMEEKQFHNGLSVKVDVSVRLAQIFKNEKLDFVMFFSSMQSFLKAAGQSNYASGCTFEDAFAKRLAKEWNCAVKVMNWGYWGSVGIVSSKEYQDRMDKTGVASIEPPEAMAALEKLLYGQIDQIALLKTKIPLTLDGKASEEFIDIKPVGPEVDVEKIQDYIDKQEELLKHIRDEGIPKQKNLEEVLCKLLWYELQTMGWFKESIMDINEFKKKTGLIEKYERWLDESIRILERNKLS